MRLQKGRQIQFQLVPHEYFDFRSYVQHAHVIGARADFSTTEAPLARPLERRHSSSFASFITHLFVID